jgi:AAA15 family ATPase/GTPase
VCPKIQDQYGDYKMIESVHITNFKGMRDVKIQNLSRVNILVGDNGSGKTSLLESLFLAGGIGPEIYLRVRAWRGSGAQIAFGLDREQYEAVWRELFFDLDQNKIVILEFTDSNSGERRLTISYDVAHSALMPLDLNQKTSYESGDIHPISWRWNTVSGEEEVSVVPIGSPAAPLPLPQIKNPYPMMFVATSTIFSPEENAKRFSFLSRRNKHQDVLKTIQSLFPIVNELSVEIVAGLPGIYASVGMEEKVSIGSISGGLTKYVALLLGIAAMPRGAVLIDEIENGFYYQKYGDVWRGITTLAQNEQTQLFVSTHSIECARAAFPVIADNPSLFSLLRTERKQRECVVKHFSGKDLIAALEQGTEFR